MRFMSLAPGYKGDGVGHSVTVEVGSTTRIQMLPRKEQGEILGWMRVRRTTKVRVQFVWDGAAWIVRSLK